MKNARLYELMKKYVPGFRLGSGKDWPTAGASFDPLKAGVCIPAASLLKHFEALEDGKPSDLQIDDPAFQVAVRAELHRRKSKAVKARRGQKRKTQKPADEDRPAPKRFEGWRPRRP
jgi:hypothetical protein